YCNPRYKFPKQDVITTAVGELVASLLQEDTIPSTSPPPSTPPPRTKTLIAIATYTIGKEKVLKQVSAACGDMPICVTIEKKRILDQLDLEFSDIFVTDSRASPVQEFLDWQNSLIPNEDEHYTRLVGIVPTGWTWEFQKHHGAGTLYTSTSKPTTPHLRIYQIPYSEHSNFDELRAFVEFLKPARVVPTVVPRGVSVTRVAAWFKDLVDVRASHKMGVEGLFG
ncbi:hypothetical protein HK104_007672, partial [Borealophlyctis nickersoniae]